MVTGIPKFPGFTGLKLVFHMAGRCSIKWTVVAVRRRMVAFMRSAGK